MIFALIVAIIMLGVIVGILILCMVRISEQLGVIELNTRQAPQLNMHPVEDWRDDTRPSAAIKKVVLQ